MPKKDLVDATEDHAVGDGGGNGVAVLVRKGGGRLF